MRKCICVNCPAAVMLRLSRAGEKTKGTANKEDRGDIEDIENIEDNGDNGTSLDQLRL